jgi:hypothetical protein
MKKCLLLLCGFLLCAAPPLKGEVLEEIWNKYAPVAEQGKQPAPEQPLKAETKVVDAAAPGRLLGVVTPERQKVFAAPWRYRAVTYELHYQEPSALARTVYGIALHARDVDKSLAPAKFVGGVLGYHYTCAQVCDWLNDVLAGNCAAPAMDETVLVGMLLQDRVITVSAGRFAPTGNIAHILAAAPGKQRSFDANLRHERLHTYWDEDKHFREQAQGKWRELAEGERKQALKKLARYAKSNEQQLIEEWAVHQSEFSNMELN